MPLDRPTLALLALLAGSTATLAEDMPGMDMPPSTKADALATAESAKAMAAMHKSMMAPYTGDADVDFASHMLPHHQGAIDMARIELKYGKDPAMRTLAQSIIQAQDSEMKRMTVWLAKHGK